MEEKYYHGANRNAVTVQHYNSIILQWLLSFFAPSVAHSVVHIPGQRNM